MSSTLESSGASPAHAEPAAIRTGLYIGGAARAADAVLEIRDPADPSAVVGYAAAGTRDDALDAVAAAKAAFPAWSALSPQERSAAILGSIEGLDEFRNEDAAILSRENGKIVGEAWGDLFVLSLRTQLAMAHVDEVDSSHVLPSGDIPVETTVRYQPLGVVTIIVPFNWPVAILGAALPHALLAGNAVIVKPPPSAPLATARVVQRMAEKLPAGVLNVVTGPDAEMGPLIAHDDVAKVSFTGSVAGGRKILALASENFTRATLELGGNDAAIILDDAVLDDAAVHRLFESVFDTTGQICMAAKRIYVHRSRYQDVVDGLSRELSSTVLGAGLAEGTTMGPLHSPRQKDFVDALIAEAKESGADVREFGTLPTEDRLAGGNFVRPALVLDPDPTLRVVTEEQFGPVIPILPFDDEEEAVAAANDTWGGLCGSVWTASEERADAIGRRLRVGYVFINDHSANRLDLRAPFGGMNASGIGREQGIEGIRDFQDTHSVGHLKL